MTISTPALRIGTLILAATLAHPVTAAPKDPKTIPDFTQGAKIPKDAKHDWNLGPTGLRGWIYCDQLVTTDARQILVTKVDKASPAAEAFQVGDVILGVGGKPFSFDPRTELGKAITTAESKAGEGKLAIRRWRAGKVGEVVLKLPVLGSYGATAPFACDKSKLLLEQGCKALAARMSKPGYAEMDAIPRSLNALALLSSGNAAYLPLVKKEAEWAAEYSKKLLQPSFYCRTWYCGYCLLFLTEYVLATGDESVMPGVKRLALASAKGQSAVGSWGHGFAIPDGRLGGYGMMNSPGVVLTTGLVLAREAGVKDAEVTVAIERSARLLRFYIGKGAIPYGDHHPWIEGHEDNGKCGMAAVLFNALGEAKGAEFFSRMSVAAHGSERDCGHCGNYFNMLWAMPSVAQSGPNATGAWMKEFGTWYFDLARRWDGSYPHQGPPENEEDSFEGWDATGTYLLAYAMPLKKIRLTGAGKSVVPTLDTAAADSLIADGRGWDNKDRNSAYDKLSGDQLVERLGSWSPVVRERAAMALARRKEAPVPAIVKLLDASSLESRYGACQALRALGKRAAPAVEPLRKCLTDKDLWLRVKAAEALAKIGPAAKPTVPKLLELLAEVDMVNDPRGMQQRYLTFALFDGGGMLRGSLDGIDREALYKAVRAGLKNEDGRARSSLTSVYRNLSVQDIKPLLPAIHRAIVEPAPSGEMFADGIRVEGLRLLAKHRIEEGIQECVRYTRQQNPWESQLRTPELMQILLSYGTHAKAVIPDLRKIASYFEKDEPDFPRELMKQKAKSVRDTIRAIEASTETPDLIKLDKEPKADPPKADPAKKPLKVFILVGQSNMQGHASISTFDSMADDPKTAPLLKEMRGPDGKPRVCEKVWISSVGCLGDAYSDLTEAKGKLTAGFAEANVALLKGEKPKDSSGEKPTEKLGSDNRFSISNVEGWIVYLNRDLLRQYPGETARTMEHLKWELYQIKLAAPALAVTNMQERNAIWIEYKEKVDLSYHPGRSWLTDRRYSIPRDPESFMSLSVATHLGDSYRHPFVVFHEFAHGYDFHFIGKGKDYGNKESQANYERMMKEGKYEKIKIWNGKLGSHYARSNRMEYWAESTEAYFAVNDFYPFVRAELREHDPQMAKFIERYWGVDSEQMVQKEKDLVAYQEELRRLGMEGPIRARDPNSKEKYIPTGQYDKRNIGGWTIYVSPRLMEQPGKCETMIQLLSYKLHMINHFLGQQGRTQLHEVPIWLEEGQAGAYVRYCGSSKQLADELANPDKFRAVEIRDPQRMLNWALLQQSDLLHQLAKASYDRLAEKDTTLVKNIQAAYKKAETAGEYKSVLRFDGKRVKHPAMTNEKEYFAELMKCYFLVNDHYPFVRCELKDHDATGFGLIAALWEGNPAR